MYDAVIIVAGKSSNIVTAAATGLIAARDILDK